MAFTKSVPPPLNPAQLAASNIPSESAASDLCSVNGSTIGEDLSIEGAAITMRCKGTLRVNGNIQADLHCVELLIGEQAVIVGTITANKVECQDVSTVQSSAMR